jgi:U3 small nucleolar RNA-associated protein 13
VICLSYNKNKNLLASGSKDQNIRLWDINTLSCVALCEGHTEAIGAVCFANKSHNNWLVSGSKVYIISYHYNSIHLIKI